MSIHPSSFILDGVARRRDARLHPSRLDNSYAHSMGNIQLTIYPDIFLRTTGEKQEKETRTAEREREIPPGFEALSACGDSTQRVTM